MKCTVDQLKAFCRLVDEHKISTENAIILLKILEDEGGDPYVIAANRGLLATDEGD